MPKTKARKSQAKPLFTADAVRTYLHEIGRVPLLTHEQEIVLGKQVQQYMHLLEIQTELTESLERSPTEAEWAAAAELGEADLAQQLRQGQRAKRAHDRGQPALWSCQRARRNTKTVGLGTAGSDPGRHLGPGARGGKI
jgi:hypothetical protein